MQLTDLHLFVATPCYGGVVTQRYMQGVVALLQYGRELGLQVSVELLGYESLITRGRNTLVAKFLDTPTATHLMFIDADIGFELRQVHEMLKFDVDVVAGMYPLKLVDWDPPAMARAREGEDLTTSALRYVGAPCEGDALERRGPYVTGEYAGTGFMMIKRQVLTRLITAHPETHYQGTHTRADDWSSSNQYALFDCIIDPKSGYYLSEDYTFCHRWRAIGGKIWLDTEGRLFHIGPHEFHGKPGVRFRNLAATPASGDAG
ncbi:MAG: hypothetical protein P4M00_02180 [Azospirillaceae bacterium]|nr:hypothetical protein [Azospirillaceae bacterium]